jgi:RNA-binding protein
VKTFGLLGTVHIITRDKLIIVRIGKPESIPGIGSKVLDANGFEVGRVIDIIGPINNPFAVVKPLSYSVLSSIKPSTVLFYRVVKRKSAAKKGGAR